MLKRKGENQLLVEPVGVDEQKNAAWLDWDRLLEMLRVMFEDPQRWRSTFQSTFGRLLSIPELMALPEQRVWWIGGDATLDRIGAIDWGNAAAGEGPC